MPLMWFKMQENIYLSEIPSAFHQANKGLCRTCLAVLILSELNILGRFLPAPGSVGLGHGVQLGGVSQRLS